MHNQSNTVFNTKSLPAGAWRVQGAIVCGHKIKAAGYRPELLHKLQRLHVIHTMRKLCFGTSQGWPGDQAQGSSRETWGASPGPHGRAQVNHSIHGHFREKFWLRCQYIWWQSMAPCISSAFTESTLLQAVTNTQAMHGFFKECTEDIKELPVYSVLLTLCLQRLLKGGTLTYMVTPRESQRTLNQGLVFPQTICARSSLSKCKLSRRPSRYRRCFPAADARVSGERAAGALVDLV